MVNCIVHNVIWFEIEDKNTRVNILLADLMWSIKSLAKNYQFTSIIKNARIRMTRLIQPNVGLYS